MKKTYKQLNTSEDDPNLISVATETKSKSAKSIGNYLFFLIIFVVGFILCVLFFPTIFFAFSMIKEAVGIWNTLVAIFASLLVLSLLGGVGWILLAIGFYGLRSKSEWYFALFKDHIHVQQLNADKTQYEKLIYPLSMIQKCLLLKKEIINLITIRGQSYESVGYSLSIHIECKKDQGNEYVHLTHLDKTEGLNKALTYLQDELNIPIYYVFAPGEMYNYEHRDERKLIHEFPQEQINFDGNIDQYKEKESLRRVSLGKALHKSQEYLNKDESSS